MQITAELSLYPFNADYIPVIKNFIETLNQHSGVTIVTNAMSTQIRGEFDEVTAVVNDAMRSSFLQDNKMVLVCKYINGGLDID